MPEREFDPKMEDFILADFKAEHWPFERMRGYPVDVQCQIISKAFGPDGFNIEHPEDISLLLAKINSIEWFITQETVSEHFVQEKIEDHLRALGVFSAKVRITNDWDDASKQRSSSAFDSLWRDKLYAHFREVGQLASEHLPGAQNELANSFSFESQDVVTNGTFVALRDLMNVLEPNVRRDTYEILIANARFVACKNYVDPNKANPFNSLFELYQHGMWPVGLRRKIFGLEFLVYA